MKQRYIQTLNIQSRIPVSYTHLDVYKRQSVTCKSSAALYVKQADKVFVTTAKDTENTLASTGDYVQTDDNNVRCV